MARFNVNRIATADSVEEVIDDAIDSADLATNSALTSGLAAKASASDLSTLVTTVSGKAAASDLTAVAADLLAGPGRPLTYAPSNFTGTGTPMLAYPMVLPSGYTIADGAKAKISGAILVRTTSGSRLARIGVENLILMRSALIAWNSGDAVAGTYDIGARVVNEGHGWVSTVNNNAVEPTVASFTGWTDLGGPMTHVWDEVSPGDVSIAPEAGLSTYFAEMEDMPGFAPFQGVLALEMTVINAQDVRIEFDGTIANIGVN